MRTAVPRVLAACTAARNEHFPDARSTHDVAPGVAEPESSVVSTSNVLALPAANEGAARCWVSSCCWWARARDRAAADIGGLAVRLPRPVVAPAMAADR